MKEELRPSSSAAPVCPKSGILIVDDEPLIRSVLNLALCQAGFEVLEAASGEEAIRVYEEHSSRIAVVLLDIRMPGLEGPQALERLQRINPQVRCCFMSGDAGGYSAEDLRRLGATCFISKPFRLAEVVDTVRGLISAPQAGAHACAAESDAAVRPERRRFPRSAGNPVEVWLLDAGHPTTPARAWILNLSQGGLCLSTTAAKEAGSMLTLRPVNAPETERWAQLEVKYHLPRTDHWAVGCQFTQTPPWDMSILA